MLHFWHQVFMKCFKIITFWRHFSKNFTALTFSVRPQWPHSSRWVSCTEAWIPDLPSIFSIFFLPQQQEKKNQWGRLLWSATGAADKLTCQCPWVSPCRPPETLCCTGSSSRLYQASETNAMGRLRTHYTLCFVSFLQGPLDSPWEDKPPVTPGRHLSSIQGRNIRLYFSFSFGCSCHV